MLHVNRLECDSGLELRHGRYSVRRCAPRIVDLAGRAVGSSSRPVGTGVRLGILPPPIFRREGHNGGSEFGGSTIALVHRVQGWNRAGYVGRLINRRNARRSRECGNKPRIGLLHKSCRREGHGVPRIGPSPRGPAQLLVTTFTRISLAALRKIVNALRSPERGVPVR